MPKVSYELGVKTSYNPDWVMLGIRFATYQQASNYWLFLSDRWNAVVEYAVFSVEEQPNFTDDL